MSTDGMAHPLMRPAPWARTQAPQRPGFALVWLALSLCGLLLGSAACSEVPATNPHDPRTPKAQQAHGSLSGRLVLPKGFSVALLEGATIRLREPAGGRDARLAELDDAGTIHQGSASDRGNEWTIDGVRRGGATTDAHPECSQFGGDSGRHGTNVATEAP